MALMKSLVFVTLVSLSLAYNVYTTCPAIPEEDLPESTFMEQFQKDCPSTHYGKIFYTCIYGLWLRMDECRCKYEVDQYGYIWWGVRVNSTETINTPNGVIQRYCEGTGWNGYIVTNSTNCPAVDGLPETSRGDSVNMCKGKGFHMMKCGPSGQWSLDTSAGKCSCLAEDNWPSVVEGTRSQKSCGSNWQYRYCGSYGIWGHIDYSLCYCANLENFKYTPYDSTNTENTCNNGVQVSRKCTSEGVWESVTYDGECKCTAAPGWQDGHVGDVLIRQCSNGVLKVKCNEVGKWKITENTCGCAAEGPWPDMLANSTHTISCMNGGTMTRTCSANGQWEAVNDSNCRCSVDGVWSATKPGEFARAGCGNGFMERQCGNDGSWTEVYDRSACYCSPDTIWPLTHHDSVASVPCSYGSKTRACNSMGIWETVDTSSCMCSAVDGFPVTPLGETATATCFDEDGVPDATHTQTRVCGMDGYWGELDQSECPVKWCPSEQSWYKVAVGTSPITVTIGCMSGTRSRVCNVDGRWGTVNVANCNCVYVTEVEGSPDIETIVHPGSEHKVNCDSGYYSYMCNAKSGYFDPVNLSNCYCSATTDGVFAKTPAGQLAAAACSIGTTVRVCSYFGHWEKADVSNCFCKEDGEWSQTTASTTSSILCDIGYRMRVCKANGVWENVVNGGCTCDDGFASSVPGAEVVTTCSDGSYKRICSPLGHYEVVDRDKCFCASKVEYDIVWNRTPVGEESEKMICMNGVEISRKCNTNTGQWDALSTLCKCTAADGIWPATPMGETAKVECGDHQTGEKTRQCLGTQWSEVNGDNCKSDCFYDRGDGEGDYIAIGSTKTFECDVNFEGEVTIGCTYNTATKKSILTLVSSTCHRNSCVTDNPDVNVDAGDSQTIACAAGATGERTRVCLSTGEWGPYDESKCEPIKCPATTIGNSDLPDTVEGKTGRGTCGEGMGGETRVKCLEGGVWDTEVDDSKCYKLHCVAKEGWPRTEAGQKATKDCPKYLYTGTWERACLMTGEWEPAVIPSSCVAIAVNHKVMPFDGMTHVSRAPDANVYSSIAVDESKIDHDTCKVKIVSVTEDTEVYMQTTNQTKTAMVGYYQNGGVFTNFVLPEDADVNDISLYLKYGEYKAIFPACFTTINDQPVLSDEVTVTFHTTPIPPSAPRNLQFSLEPSQFYVTFDESEYVDEPFPVVSYILSFQPPVIPEQVVSNKLRRFGPFPYVGGEVMLLARAENAYGLSSPDVILHYVFDEILNNGSVDLVIATEAPIIELESLRTLPLNALEVTVRVSMPPSLQSHYSLTTLVCDGANVELVPLYMGPAYHTFTISQTATSLTVSCFYKINDIEGITGTSTISFTVPTNRLPAPEEFTVTERVAGELTLRWKRPQFVSSEVIKGYYYECLFLDKPSAKVSGIVTAEEVSVRMAVSESVAREGQCMVASTDSLTQLNVSAEQVSQSFEEMHEMLVEDIEMSIGIYSTFLHINVTSPLPVHSRITVFAEGKKSVVFGPLTTMEEEIIVSGLKKDTVYIVENRLMDFENEDMNEDERTLVRSIRTAESFTTPLHQFTQMSIVESSLTAHSVTIGIECMYPDTVLCVAHTTATIDDVMLLNELRSGLRQSDVMNVNANEVAFKTITSLQPAHGYFITCVSDLTSQSVTSTQPFETTSPLSSFLRVVHVDSADFIGETNTVTRVPTFVLTMNAAVELGNARYMTVSCGGASLTVPLTQQSLSLDRTQVTVPITQTLPVNTVCSLKFGALDSVRILNYYERSSTMLSTTPFTLENDVVSAFYPFTVGRDILAPHIVAYGGSVNVLADGYVSLGYVSEQWMNQQWNRGNEYEIKCNVVETSTTITKTLSLTDKPFMYRVKPISKTNKNIVNEMMIYTGSLPQNAQCEMRVVSEMVRDGVMNNVVCEKMEGTLCVVPFVATAESGIELKIVEYVPRDKSTGVSPYTAITLRFNREVEALKDVSMRCDECVTTQVNIKPVCEGYVCKVISTTAWELNKRYVMVYDDITFQALYTTVTALPPAQSYSFTTTSSVCSMEYIAADWDPSCVCVNTSTHCQCTCGDTAILRPF